MEEKNTRYLGQKNKVKNEFKTGKRSKSIAKSAESRRNALQKNRAELKEDW